MIRVLADSSVWIAYLRYRTGETAQQLQPMLAEKRIVMTIDVVGELAMGTLAERDRFLGNLSKMDQIPRADPAIVLLEVDQERLWGKGLGWTDAHLLAAVLYAGRDRFRLWTLEGALCKAAERLGVAWRPSAR